jgi:hypothetical protein
MEKDFSYYKEKGDKYFFASMGRGKTTSESVHNLDEALEYYRTARARTQNEFDRSVIAGKINQVHKELGSLREPAGEGLSRRVYAFLSITAILFALFLTSYNVTGNIISGMISSDTQWIGICFFLCGLTFTFLFLKSKK